MRNYSCGALRFYFRSGGVNLLLEKFESVFDKGHFWEFLVRFWDVNL